MAAANKSLIFHNQGFRMTLPGLPKSSKRYRSTAHEGNGTVTLYRPAAKALCLYCCDGHAYYDNITPPSQTSAEFVSAVGTIKTDDSLLIVSEYRQMNQTHLAVFDTKKAEFLFCGISEDGGEHYRPYALDYEEARNGTVLWMCLIPYLSSQSSECKDILANQSLICQNYKEFALGNVTSLPKDTENLFFRFSDHAYYALGRKPKNVAEIPLFIPSSGFFPEPPDVVRSGAYKPEIVLSGQFSLVGFTGTGSQAPAVKSLPDARGFKCMYALDPSVDPSTIQDIPNWYQLSEKDVKIAELVHEGLNDKDIAASMKPRNLMFYGPPGTGKTEAAKVAASAWGLPFAVVHGSANTTEEDIVGRFQPTEPMKVELDIEELLDVAQFAPEQAFFDLTGQENLDASYADVIKAYGDYRACAAAAEGGINIHYQKSPVMDVIEHGGVLIFEEPTNVRDSSVLTILNGLMDGYESIRLGDGRTVRRHPHCIVIFAANVDEQQTGELQTSTLGRLHHKFEFSAPNDAEMMKRVQALTGFSEVSDLTVMVNVGKLLRKHIADNALVGVCGVRELAAWAIATKIARKKDPNVSLYETAYTTILPSASPHKEDQEEICSSILDTELL